MDALLSAVRGGEVDARDRLLSVLYPELRRLATAIFSDQRQGHTLQPTALVHEAWIKLAGNLPAIEDKRHFLVVAGIAMRQVLMDHARNRRADKRGGDAGRVTLDLGAAAAGDGGVELVALDDCLQRLAELNPRHARVAELRVFSGLTVPEVAEELGVSPRSVDSDWAMAKAWLRSRLAQ